MVEVGPFSSPLPFVSGAGLLAAVVRLVAVSALPGTGLLLLLLVLLLLLLLLLAFGPGSELRPFGGVE